MARHDRRSHGARRGERPRRRFVEAKGLTVTLHWRGAPEAERWARAFAEADARRRVWWGSKAGSPWSSVRRSASTKGPWSASSAAGHPLVACFGDDLGDLPAFAALDELAAEGAHTVKVAVKDTESPPEVAAAADLVVVGPSSTLALLRALAEG